MLEWCLKEVQKDVLITDRSLRLFQGPLVHDVSEHGQQEGDGFPTASLSNTNEVSARHDSRDCLSLDGGGLLIAVPGYITQIYDVLVCGNKESSFLYNLTVMVDLGKGKF